MKKKERKKYQKVRCPYCKATSNVFHTMGTMQIRKCKNKHNFVYDSELEYIYQRSPKVRNIAGIEENSKTNNIKRPLLKWDNVLMRAVKVKEDV